MQNLVSDIIDKQTHNNNSLDERVMKAVTYRDIAMTFERIKKLNQYFCETNEALAN